MVLKRFHNSGILRALVFLLLWLVSALMTYPIPVGPGGWSWLVASMSIVSLLGYIAMAASYSRVLMDVAMEDRRIAQGSLLLAALLLLLLLVFHGRFVASLWFALVQSAVLLTGATLLGTLLSGAVKRPGELVPIALTGAAADIASVFHGPTRDMGKALTAYYGGAMQGPPPLVDLFLLKSAGPGGIVQPLFGISDWILVILLSSALIRLGGPDNLPVCGPRSGSMFSSVYFPITAAGLFTSLIVAWILHLYIPALFFICLFFLLHLFVRGRVWRELTRRDLCYSLLFPGAVAGLILLLAR